MKALVTGGAGFIGSHVVRQLIDTGVQVRVLHLPRENLRNLKDLDVELLEGNITDAAAMARATKGVNYVFHMAAIYALWLPQPSKMRTVNVEGTRTVLAAAKANDVERVIYTSSIACFGGQGHGVRATEKSPFALGKTGDLYAITKYEAHQIALKAAAGGQDIVIVAPTGPLGPQDIAPTPTGRLLLTAAQLPAMAVPDSINNVVDVRDVARGHLLAALRGKSGESYLLGNQDLSTLEFVKMVHRVLGVRRPIAKIPFIAGEAAARAALWVTENVTRKAPIITPTSIAIARLGLAADCSKAVRELGLPQTPIESAVRDALRWFTERGYLKGVCA